MLIRTAKRGVSPVIAAILLIGLVVVASALTFLIVIPMFNPSKDWVIDDRSTIKYDKDMTRFKSAGWAKATVVVYNQGTPEIEITNITIEYEDGGNWFKVPEQTNPVNATSTESIGGGKDSSMTVFFKLASKNIDSATNYRIKVKEKDTAQFQETDLGDFNLDADRPTVSSLSITDGTYARNLDVSVVAGDNILGEIKNVTYSVYDSSYTMVENKTVTASPWTWDWDTRAGGTALVDLGSYSLEAKSYDYANLGSVVEYSNITIDNDYTVPTIVGPPLVLAPRAGGTAEVGQDVTIGVNVTDTGSFASGIGGVALYYRENTSVSLNSTDTMEQQGLTDEWQGTISSAKVTLSTITNDITYFVRVMDIDGNVAWSSSSNNGTLIQVEDTVKPNIFHTAVTEGNYHEAINVNATITDIQTVTAYVIYRTVNDTGTASTFGSWDNTTLTNTSGVFSGVIYFGYSVLDGIDYFIMAVDPSGNVATDNASSTTKHIDIIDNEAPDIFHAPVTSSIEATDISILATITDNDPTFNTTGTVRLRYRKVGDNTYNLLVMSYDSATDQWNGTIPSAIVTTLGVEYYLECWDQGFNQLTGPNTKIEPSASSPNAISVLSAGTPIIQRDGSVQIRLGNQYQLRFNVTNTGDTSGTWDTMKITWISGVATIGATLVEINETGAFSTLKSGGITNGAEFSLTSTFTLSVGESKELRITFGSTLMGNATRDVFETNFTSTVGSSDAFNIERDAFKLVYDYNKFDGTQTYSIDSGGTSGPYSCPTGTGSGEIVWLDDYVFDPASITITFGNPDNVKGGISVTAYIYYGTTLLQQGSSGGNFGTSWTLVYPS